MDGSSAHVHPTPVDVGDVTAPTEKLNRILWRQVRGYATPYPPIRKSVFSPLSPDIDDDDRE
jgi:hypothetical protein